MLDTFIYRQRFSYNIPSLDNLLQTEAIPDSFLEFDEQILVILKAAGIPGPEAYGITKAIKKKKTEKVLAAKDKFKTGFTKLLKETENASDEHAEKVVEQVWTIIENSASYLFCRAHALSMACDSLYVAWLKVHYPYELYTTMLKIYDEKKNKDKIAQIIAEMKRFKGITVTPGQFRQDNRDWFVDKDNKIISQSMSSIRYMQKKAAEELYKLGLQDAAEMGVVFTKDVMTPSAKSSITKLTKQVKPLQERGEKYLADGGDIFDEEFMEMYEKGCALEEEIKRIQADPTSYISKAEEIHSFAKLDCFTNVLRAIQMNTHIDTRQLEILITLGYFNEYGKSGKLMRVCNEFFNGEKKLTKTIKSFEERLERMREFEKSVPDTELPADIRLRNEFENIGLCLTTEPSASNLLYFVQNIDDKYGIKIKLYNIRRGKIGEIRIARKDYKEMAVGSCIQIIKYRESAKYTYRNGQKMQIPGEKEYWVSEYKVMKQGEVA